MQRHNFCWVSSLFIIYKLNKNERKKKSNLSKYKVECTQNKATIWLNLTNTKINSCTDTIMYNVYACFTVCYSKVANYKVFKWSQGFIK